MSSSSQATDLSMDEILASIRKIIAEEPKTGPTATPKQPVPSAGAVSSGGGRSASQIMTSRQGVGDIVESGAGVTRPGRATKAALDDDILDLMDEVRPPAPPTPKATPVARTEAAKAEAAPAASATAVANAAPAAQPTAQAQSVPVEQPTPPAKPSLNDMWTPREWSRTSEAATPKTPVPSAASEPAKGGSEAPEARLEAAIAALGQSLASPSVAAAPAKSVEPPAKPIVVAAAPPEQPGGGPRVDVVAVVNAATRAALAQRSADQQVANPAFALPPEAKAEVSARKSDDKPASAAQTVVPAPTMRVAASPAPAVEAQPTEKSSEAAAHPKAVQSQPMPAPAAPPVAVAAPAAVSEARVAPAVTAQPQLPPRIQPAPAPAATATAAHMPAGIMTTAASAVVAPPSTGASAPQLPLAAAPVPAPSSASAAPMAPSVPVPAAQSTPAQASTPAPAGVQTLEDTVARLLRPMLRQWLDDNMPRIVEKAFKEELAAQAPRPRAGKPN